MLEKTDVLLCPDVGRVLIRFCESRGAGEICETRRDLANAQPSLSSSTDQMSELQ